jgi:acyl-CoA synthetase (NDP forming)
MVLSYGDRRSGINAPCFVFQDTPPDEEIAAKPGRLSRQRRIEPILCCGMGGPYTEKMARAIEAAGAPVYRTVREWVAAAAAARG